MDGLHLGVVLFKRKKRRLNAYRHSKYRPKSELLFNDSGSGRSFSRSVGGSVGGERIINLYVCE